MLWTAAIVAFITIPVTDAVLITAVFAFAIVRSLTVLPEMGFAPWSEVIPLITPASPAVEFVVPLVSFEIVFPLMVTVPIPALYIPYTLCTAEVEVEAALILLLVPASVLPMVLELIVIAPLDEFLCIPKKSVE